MAHLVSGLVELFQSIVLSGESGCVILPGLIFA